MKRTPLKRTTGLKRGGELKRTPLKKRSKKTQERYEKERIPFVKRLLKERPVCEICLRRQSVDVHEILTRGRSGGVHGDDWLDEDNCLCLCRWCHDWIDVNQLEAEKYGWLRRS
jgi:hypothetical protein